jgi:hypothetical protein
MTSINPTTVVFVEGRVRFDADRVTVWPDNPTAALEAPQAFFQQGREALAKALALGYPCEDPLFGDPQVKDACLAVRRWALTLP